MASNSLLQSIQNAVGAEAIRVFEDAKLTSDDNIEQLCYETLRDLFPATDGKTLVLRSKIWKIVSTAKPSLPLESKENLTCLGHSAAQSGDCEPSIETYVPEVKKSKVHLLSPEYVVYKDHDLDTAAKAGKIAPDLRQRLVRATISNMMATAYAAPYNRLPTNQEINEMAKSLIITYPCLRDNDTGHGLLSKQLQKRLYNEKAKSKKKEKAKVSTLTALEQNSPKVPISNSSEVKESMLSCEDQKHVECKANDDVLTESLKNTGDDADSSGEYPDEMMIRHYNSLSKEMHKSKPNVQIVNFYLNKEFQARRKWVLSTAAQKRCKEFFLKYPCFQDHVEMVEEVRRVLKQPENKNRMAFLEACVKRLESKVDLMIYYGVSKKVIEHPSSPTLNAKFLHAFQNISTIFPAPGKKKKNEVDVVYHMEDHEDPDQWLGQRRLETPVLVITAGTDMVVYLVVGKKILCTFECKDISKAIVAYLASYYVLDFDYPQTLELGLSVLQYFCFEDKATPADVAKSFNNAVAEFNKYVAVNCK